jgi:hypothetical protein
MPLRILSSPRFNPVTDRWDVDETDSTGKVSVEKHDFASRGEADGFIRSVLMDNTLAPEPEKKIKRSKKLDGEIKSATLLSDSLNNLGDSNFFDNIPEGIGMDQLNEELKQKSVLWKASWKKAKEGFQTKAAALVTGVAKVYFDNRLMKKYEYVAYKQEMESGNIATLLQQIDVAENAVCSLSETIEGGNALPRHYEVLAQMQKLITELLKAKDEFVNRLEEGYKTLRDELTMVESLETTESGDSSKDSKQKLVITTTSRKQLIEVVQSMSYEMEQYMKIPSGNSRLIQDGDTLGGIQEAEYAAETDQAYAPVAKGLDTFEDD